MSKSSLFLYLTMALSLGFSGGLVVGTRGAEMRAAPQPTPIHPIENHPYKILSGSPEDVERELNNLAGKWVPTEIQGNTGGVVILLQRWSDTSTSINDPNCPPYEDKTP